MRRLGKQNSTAIRLHVVPCHTTAAGQGGWLASAVGLAVGLAKYFLTDRNYPQLRDNRGSKLPPARKTAAG